MSKRLAIILAAIVSGSLIVAALIVVIALNVVNGNVQEADYRACLSDRGFHETTDTEEWADIAAACHESVYGS